MDLENLLPAGSLDALAGQLGVSRDEARQGAEGLLPSIMAGFVHRAGSAEAPDASALHEQLSALGGAGLAENVIGPQPTEVDKGNVLLGHIFGSKDVSRQVAGQASQTTGLSPDTVTVPVVLPS